MDWVILVDEILQNMAPVLEILLKEGLCSAYSHDGIIGTGFILPPLTTITLDKLKNNGFHILDNRQSRTLIPEKKEASEVRPAIPLAFGLEAFLDPGAGKGVCSKAQLSSESRDQKAEFKREVV